MPNSFQISQIKESFSDLVRSVRGPIDVSVSGVSSAEHTVDGSLVFCSKPKLIAGAASSKANAIVVPEAHFASVPEVSGKTVIGSPNPELLMARVIDRFVLKTPYRDFSGKAANVTIDASANVDATAILAPGAYIGRNVKVGANAYIGVNSVVESNSEIGDGTTIQSNVVIGTRVRIGKNVEIGAGSIVGKEGFGYAHDALGNHTRIPHQGWVIIEDEVNLGANNNVDRGTFGDTRIGRGTKTDNEVHIAHNCEVGRGCLLTSGLKMGGSSKIGNYVITGGNTVIAGHISVADGVNLAATTALGKTIDKKGDYGGNPTLPVKDFIRMKVALTRLFDTQQKVKKLMEKIFPDEV